MASGWFIGVYISLGYSLLHQNNRKQAVANFNEALESSRKLNYTASIIHCLAGFAALAAHEGNSKESAFLFGAADAQFQSLIAEGEKPELLIEPIDQKEFEHYQALCRSQLGTDEFDHEMEKGRGMTLNEAINFALENVDE